MPDKILPLDTLGGPNSSESLQPAANLITGTLLDLSRAHFGSGEIADPGLRGLVWSRSPDSPILIQSVGDWSPDMEEKRPAIVIKRNAFSGRKLAINQGNTGQGSATGQAFARQYVGSTTLFCLAQNDSTTDRLANEIGFQLEEFAPVIRRELKLHKLELLEVGAAAELEEAHETVAVPLVVGYCFERRWQLLPQALRVRVLNLVIQSHV